jgi:VanZ family protein
MKLRSLILRWLPAVAMMAAIFAFSSIPSGEMPNFNWADLRVKKGGHMLGYALLAVAFWRGLERDDIMPEGDSSRRTPWILAWLLTLLYAASDEFHQFFVPGRNASPVDVGIDALGAAIGLGILILVVNRKSAR